VVTIYEAHWDYVDGDTTCAHAEDRDGCVISHHDKLAADRNVGYVAPESAMTRCAVEIWCGRVDFTVDRQVYGIV
jgi:hypothetical protein